VQCVSGSDASIERRANPLALCRRNDRMASAVISGISAQTTAGSTVVETIRRVRSVQCRPRRDESAVSVVAAGTEWEALVAMTRRCLRTL
jgi:hypothetical protein